MRSVRAFAVSSGGLATHDDGLDNPGRRDGRLPPQAHGHSGESEERTV
jgi:hypothetical protein